MLHTLGSTLYCQGYFPPISNRCVVLSYCAFICIFPITNDIGHLFVYFYQLSVYLLGLNLLPTFLFALFYFAFQEGFFFFPYIFWISTFHQICIFLMLSPSLLLDFFLWFFKEQRFLMLMNSKISMFLPWLVIFILYLRNLYLTQIFSSVFFFIQKFYNFRFYSFKFYI